MTVDEGRRTSYIWHDMPEDVRKEMERRRSSVKDPEEVAGVPPLAPAAKDTRRKVNKAQQTVDSKEYPRNKEEPRRQKKEGKKEYPKEVEEEPQQQEEEENREYPKEEEKPRRQKKEGKKEYPKEVEEEPQQQEEEENREYRKEEEKPRRQKKEGKKEYSKEKEEEEPQQQEEEENREYPKEVDEEPQQHEEEEQKEEYPKEDEEPQQHEEEEKREYPEEEEEGGGAQKQGEEEESQAAEKKKESQDVEVQQPQTVGSSKDARTKHTIRFRGPKWDNVVKNHPRALETAFKKDVNEASDLPEERISGLQFQVDDVLIAMFTVRHENDEEKMNEVHTKLRSFDFPNTTGLYKKEKDNQNPEENEASQDENKRRGSQSVEVQQPQTVGTKKNAKTNHTVRFRGSKWESVLKKHHSALETAFKKDVKEATDLPERRILGLKFQYNDVLIATFSIRHENDEEKMSEVHEKLRSFDFPHTTGLYKKEKDNHNSGENEASQDEDKRRGSQDVDVQKPQTVGSKKDGKTNHTVRFRGSNWENVLQNDRNGLETAFKKDVTEATDLSDDRISGLNFQYNEVLIVKFAVRHENDEERMNEVHPRLRSFSFPNTTALYQE